MASEHVDVFVQQGRKAGHIAYYNAERRHSALGYLAPNHFETKIQATS